jgi:hypothetical protein
MKFHGPNHGFSTISRQRLFPFATPRFTDLISVFDLLRIRSIDRGGCGVVYQPLRDLHFYEGTQPTALATTMLRADSLLILI